MSGLLGSTVLAKKHGKNVGVATLKSCPKHTSALNAQTSLFQLAVAKLQKESSFPGYITYAGFVHGFKGRSSRDALEQP